MPLDDLPRLDEHSLVVAAAPDIVWDAALESLRESFSGSARLFARLLGCDPSEVSGWDRPAVGSSIPGFRVVAADRPRLLVLAGRHRFSRYGIVLRLEPGEAGTLCRLESRGAFPGPHGRLYRMAVIGSGGHVVGVRRLLRGIREAVARNRS